MKLKMTGCHPYHRMMKYNLFRRDENKNMANFQKNRKPKPEYPYGEVQVDFHGTKTSLPVVWREGVLAKSTIKSEGVSTEMTN